jgi:AbrB family looped-hinge helix DNA binding protein
MTIARVTTKGQVTIPVQIRKSLGIEEGDALIFEIIQEDEARLRVIRRKKLMDLYGILPATRPFPSKEAIHAELGQRLGQQLTARLENEG